MTLEEAYRELEVEPGATADVVRQARNILLRVWHPDRHEHDPNLRMVAERKTASINEAFGIVEASGIPDAAAFKERSHLDHAGESEARLRERELDLREREVAVKERLAAKPTTTEWIDGKAKAVGRGITSLLVVAAIVVAVVVGVVLVSSIHFDLDDPNTRTAVAFGVIAFTGYPLWRYLTRKRF